MLLYFESLAYLHYTGCLQLSDARMYYASITATQSSIIIVKEVPRRNCTREAYGSYLFFTFSDRARMAIGDTW